MEAPKASFSCIVLIISVFAISGSWAQRMHRPYFQNRNFNNPYVGYQNQGEYNQGPYPNYSGFPNNGFRPFQPSPFGFGGQQSSPFANIFNNMFQQQNPFFNGGNRFGLGQPNMTPGVIDKAQPAPGQGQDQGIPQYGLNKTPGQENIYTNGQMPFFGGQNPQIPSGHFSGQNQPSTSQVPTTAQSPNVLTNGAVQEGQGHLSGAPAPSTSQVPTTAQGPSILPTQEPTQGQNSNSELQRKPTSAQAPTSGQRPGLLPHPGNPASNPGQVPKHHMNGKSPSTSQVPTTAQAPAVLPPAVPTNQKLNVKEQEVDLDILDVTLDKVTGKDAVPVEAVPAKESKVPANTNNDVNSKKPEPSSKAPMSDYDYDDGFEPSATKSVGKDKNKASEALPKLDVRGNKNKKADNTAPAAAPSSAKTPAWAFIEEEIVS